MLSKWAGFHNTGFFCLSLHICKFVQSMLPEMGERNFSFYLVLDATCLKLGPCRLVGSTPHLLRSPNLSWFMNSLQNLPPSFFFDVFCPCEIFFCKNMTGYKFPETCLWSGRSSGPHGRLACLLPWATNWFPFPQTLQFVFFLDFSVT